MGDFFHTIRVNSINKIYLLISLSFWFLSFICSTFSINSLKIIFKWSPPLTSMKCFTLLSFFNACLLSFFNACLLSFFSRLHLLLSSGSVSIFCYYLNGSKVSSKFLFTNHHIWVGVTGKRVNPGVGMGLEITVKYFFL